jgi:ABC-type glycerol-3-phosphate transport system substrate-binding protein
MKKVLALALIACAALSAAAAAQTASARADATTSLTIYSGREERLVKPLFDRFTQQTGITLNVRPLPPWPACLPASAPPVSAGSARADAPA